ncbi:MAG: hypothetical protein KJ077_27525 [Anaerolineae bacterium]|nr:hypothetical protein [Anaerolineae bacterium]
MPPIEPKKKVMHPTTPRRLAERITSLEKEMKRLREEPIVDSILLGCGCKVVIHNFNGIMIKYCDRHVTFHYSPYHEEGDVLYFVTEDNRP